MVVSKKSKKLNTHINERFSIKNSKTFSFINKQEKKTYLSKYDVPRLVPVKEASRKITTGVKLVVNVKKLCKIRHFCVVYLQFFVVY